MEGLLDTAGDPIQAHVRDAVPEVDGLLKVKTILKKPVNNEKPSAYSSTYLAQLVNVLVAPKAANPKPQPSQVLPGHPAAPSRNPSDRLATKINKDKDKDKSRSQRKNGDKKKPQIEVSSHDVQSGDDELEDDDDDCDDNDNNDDDEEEEGALKAKFGKNSLKRPSDGRGRTGQQKKPRNNTNDLLRLMAAQMVEMRKDVTAMQATQSLRIAEAYQKGVNASSNRPGPTVEEEELRVQEDALAQSRQSRHQGQDRQVREFNYDQPHSSTGNNIPLFSSPLAVQKIKVIVQQSSPSASVICTAMNGPVPCLANNSPFASFCGRCRAPLPRDRDYYKH